jgi:hypothetical protein
MAACGPPTRTQPSARRGAPSPMTSASQMRMRSIGLPCLVFRVTMR